MFLLVTDSLYSRFLYPIRTGTYCPLPDRLPARCPEKTAPDAAGKLDFRTSTIDRTPCRSDRHHGPLTRMATGNACAVWTRLLAPVRSRNSGEEVTMPENGPGARKREP